MVEAHYNQARQEEAARRFQETLREERARTAAGAAPQSGPELEPAP